MELAAGWTVLGWILLALGGSQRTFAQNCLHHPQLVIASGSYSTTITSPNYPLDYYDNLECTWRIQIEDKLDFGGYVLKVIFSDFQLQHDSALSLSSCQFDNLKFYDGWSESAPFLGAYCGTVHPEVIYSSGNNMYVKFHTDSSSTFRGFSINVSVVEEEKAAGICRKSNDEQSRCIVKGSSGTLFSPNYPAPYLDRTTCIWTIYVPVGKRVELKFEDFVLGKSVIDAGYNNNCKYHKLANNMDYVEMRDGEWSGTKELGSYCGNNTGINVYSSGHSMWVKFQAFSNGMRGKRGFKAHFEAVDLLVDEELCLPGNQNNLNLTLTGSHGTLQSPLYYYPVELYCEWLITVPDGKIVELSFEKFELDVRGAEGCDDYVQVHDGRSMESDTIGSYCGHTIPAPVKSSSQYMRVRFQADSVYNKPHRGFKATFKAVDKSKALALAIGITVSVIFLIVLACCVVRLVKRRKTPNRAPGAGIPMSTVTTSASPTTQPGVDQHSPCQPAGNPYPPPPVGYAPVPTNPPAPLPAYPYPLESPPPYPGEECVPQYPPPGQSYPWQQSSGSALLLESS